MEINITHEIVNYFNDFLKYLQNAKKSKYINYTPISLSDILKKENNDNDE